MSYVAAPAAFIPNLDTFDKEPLLVSPRTWAIPIILPSKDIHVAQTKQRSPTFQIRFGTLCRYSLPYLSIRNQRRKEVAVITSWITRVDSENSKLLFCAALHMQSVTDRNRRNLAPAENEAERDIDIGNAYYLLQKNVSQTVRQSIRKRIRRRIDLKASNKQYREKGNE
jgi:hypothetical protein